MVTDEMVEKACLAYWGDKNMTSMFGRNTREGVMQSMRNALEAVLSTDAEPVAGRNDEAGYVEFLNEDVPYIVRDIEGRCAILVDLHTRKYIGYRVYDPDSDFGSHGGNAEPVKTAPAVSLTRLAIRTGGSGANVYAFTEADDDGDYVFYTEAKSALAAQVQDVAVKPLNLGALRNYFMALREADLSWSEMPTALYTYLLMDGYVSEKAAKEQIRSALSASPASKHGYAE